MTLSRRSLFRLAGVAGGAALVGPATNTVAGATPQPTDQQTMRLAARLSPATPAGVPAHSSARIPTGEKFISVRFPSAAQDAGGGDATAQIRVTRANGQEQMLTVHPSAHQPDHVVGATGSEPIGIAADAVAVEFVDATGTHADNPTLHVQSLEQQPDPEFRELAVPAPAHGAVAAAAANAADTAQGVQPYAAGPLAGSSPAGSSDALMGSMDILGQIGDALDKLPAPAPLPGAPAGSDPLAELGIITRAQWGANESWRTWGTAGTRAQCVTIHHSAIPAGNDYAANVRAIYQYHATTINGGQGWGDIGYHLLVDPAGRIYQGRATGVTGRSVFTNTSGVLESVTAGHVGGANNGNIGICMLGDFTSYAPTTAAINATTRAVSALCRALNLDPRSQVNYSNGSRSARKPAVTGHRDWADFAGWTSCPGDQAYPLLDQIRAGA